MSLNFINLAAIQQSITGKEPGEIFHEQFGEGRRIDQKFSRLAKCDDDICRWLEVC